MREKRFDGTLHRRVRLQSVPIPKAMVRSTQQVLAILRGAKPELEREFGVTRVALFGPYARGEQRQGSDVDVLVDFDASLGLRFVDLAERIEALVGLPSDVVSRRAISPRHWEVIENELVDV